jgi:aminoglycoside phosphotransferase (APT) family kinase protein
MADIAADRDLAATLRGTRRTWQDRCLIHGDVRRENVLTAQGVGDAIVKVIDWELSGSGDPAWDLAGVLGEVTLDSVRQCRETDTSWSPAQRAVVKTFVRTYRAHGGLVEADAAAFWHHVVSCAVARVLHVACEWAEMQVSGARGPELSLLSAARGLLQRRSRLAATLTRWAEA